MAWADRSGLSRGGGEEGGRKDRGMEGLTRLNSGSWSNTMNLFFSKLVLLGTEIEKMTLLRGNFLEMGHIKL